MSERKDGNVNGLHTGGEQDKKCNIGGRESLCLCLQTEEWKTHTPLRGCPDILAERQWDTEKKEGTREEKKGRNRSRKDLGRIR